MGFIDSDTHVLETDDTWSYLEPSERHYEPLTVAYESAPNPDAEVLGETVGQWMWLVGDAWTRRHPTNGLPKGIGKDFGHGKTDLTDVPARLADMDALGVDAQILISTFFIGIEVEHPLAEAALMRSWNRWVADRTAGARDRLKWVLMPPTRLMDRALAELEFGAANGAVGVMMKGMEHGIYLDDPYFYPLYEKAQDLGLTICVHLGTATRRVNQQPIGTLFTSVGGLMDHCAALAKGFWSVMASDLHQRFPRLAFTFVEGGATWVPGVFQQHQRLLSTSARSGWVPTANGTGLVVDRLNGAELMAERNLFVTVESDEDLPYLSSLLGSDNLLFGTDYGHNDVGSDPLGHSTILTNPYLDPATATAIVDTNGRQLYNITVETPLTASAGTSL
jgi:predicted TIM-barrel fold metal-dependent hydrolase